MVVLVFNTGSASLKFDLIAVERGQTSARDGSKLLSGIIESIGPEAVLSRFDGKDVPGQHRVQAGDIREATEQAVEWMRTERPDDVSAVRIVGHRVVHGADRFSGPVWIDDNIIQAIKDLESIAPLHNRPAVETIQAAATFSDPTCEWWPCLIRPFIRPCRSAPLPMPCRTN